MENDQVRQRIIIIEGLLIYILNFKGLLVDLYVPRKCAATSEYTSPWRMWVVTQLLTVHHTLNSRPPHHLKRPRISAGCDR
jgi:hypothetical protein